MYLSTMPGPESELSKLGSIFNISIILVCSPSSSGSAHLHLLHHHQVQLTFSVVFMLLKSALICSHSIYQLYHSLLSRICFLSTDVCLPLPSRSHWQVGMNDACNCLHLWKTKNSAQQIVAMLSWPHFW